MTYGVDIAKNVIQVHWIDPATGEIHRRKLGRAQVLAFFARREAGRVAMEACGSAHHWGRRLQELGHTVELLPAHQVRGFVTGNKDDAADARAICLAAQHKDIRRVSVKSEGQQAQLAVHRLRSHWISVRTASINCLRGLLYEFGVTLPKGRPAAMNRLGHERAAIDAQLPALMQRLLDGQLQCLRELDARIAALDGELKAVHRSNETALRLAKVPGIGLIGATALAGTLGDGSSWKRAREFAACIGLAPRHSGTGGKVHIGSISKRGDAYLRTLLIHGARNLVRAANPPQWIAQMLQRRPFNVVAVAVAHKLARIAWAMTARGSSYEPRWIAASAAH
jgi:transposase